MVKAMDKRATGSADEIHLDQLLGRPVRSANNHVIGRLEELRVEQQHGAPVVTDYVIGRAGLAERLGVGARLLVGIRGRGYVARWDQLDITNPGHPRLTCSVKELRVE